MNLSTSLGEAVATGGWPAFTRILEGPWGWKGVPAPKPPCAHRCRSGDYLVAAVAVATGALLVSDDQELRQQI